MVTNNTPTHTPHSSYVLALLRSYDLLGVRSYVLTFLRSYALTHVLGN